MHGPVADERRDLSRLDFGRVVVVDDRYASCTVVVDCLRADGFDAIGCTSHAEARAVLARARADLVVIGPEVTDLAKFCSWIRARSAVPVVVIATDRRFDVAEVLDAGADLVVVEPLRPRELLARVRAVLRRVPPRRSGHNILGYGGMKLDPTDRVLHLEGGSIQLGGRAFTLVETLMVAGSAVTPRSHLHAVLSVGDAELDGHVRRLRDRLEAIEGWRRIVSVRGRGFRLLEERPPTHSSPTHA